MKRGSTGSPVNLTKENILSYILDCQKLLDENDVTRNDRWVEIPKKWAEQLFPRSFFIKKLTLRIKNMSKAGLTVEQIASKLSLENSDLFKSEWNARPSSTAKI